MPAEKKYTQFIFDDIRDPIKAEPYGYLGLAFELFADLTKIRNSKLLTQHEVAQKADITQPTLARIEAGRANPSLSQLIKIACALDHKITFTPHTFKPGNFEGYLE